MIERRAESTMMNGDLQRYFTRIGYSGSSEPSLDNLRQITWLHQLAIPFENLDIVLFRRPISLAAPNIVAKLVDRNRGGFCFEQNGLLGQMLTSMGYVVSFGYATWMDEGSMIDPFDHLVLRVDIPGETDLWLADAGFGRQSPARPIPLVVGREEHHLETGITYRVLPSPAEHLQWSVHYQDEQGTWAPLYDLDLRPRQMSDYEHRSLYHQTSPDSHFTRGAICSRPVPGGRVTVADGKLILTMNGERDERPLASREEERAVLREWFGIDTEQEQTA